MYLRKGLVFQKPNPPAYLVNCKIFVLIEDIEEENKKLINERAKYAEEEASLIIHVYEAINFFVRILLKIRLTNLEF